MFTPPDEPQLINRVEPITEEGIISGSEGEINEADIHTMPGQFLETNVPKKRGHLNWLILGIVIFVALGAIIVTVVLFIGRQGEETALVNLNEEPANINAGEENVNASTLPLPPENANVNQNLSSAEGRDQKLLEDISGLRTALALYFQTYQLFPTSLDGLLTEFIEATPKDPATGEEYNYEAGDDQLIYVLLFSLEEGTAWGVVNLPAGDYYATSDGVFPAAAAEVNENVNENTNAALPQAPLVNVPPQKGLDSDGDQLTDIEENLYQTSATLADTDADGYTDATELLSHFDPKTAGGRLINSGLIDVYQNLNFNYSTFYPSAWVARSLTTTNSEVIFTSTTGEFIEIIVQSNPLGQSAYQWYLTQNPVADPASLKNVTVAGLSAIQTADGLTTYLAIGSNVYIIAYNIGAQLQMNFYTTYQLFLKSFIFINASQEAGAGGGFLD